MGVVQAQPVRRVQRTLFRVGHPILRPDCTGSASGWLQHWSCQQLQQNQSRGITNGAYTTGQVASNPICFASEFTKASLPGITGLPLTNPLLSPLVNALNAVTGPLNCAAIGSVNQTAFAACPGFSLYGGTRGPVAPGAIQTP